MNYSIIRLLWSTVTGYDQEEVRCVTEVETENFGRNFGRKKSAFLEDELRRS